MHNRVEDSIDKQILRVAWWHPRVWKGYAQRWLRRGRTFRRLLAELEEHERWSPAQLAAYQESHLRELLIECAAHVPYYQRLFAELRLDPARLPPRQCLAALPLLTKDDVRRQPQDFVNRRIPRWRRRKAHTSGTTGTPLVCWRDLYAINFEHAMIWRHWHWAGFHWGERRVTLRGELVAPTSRTTPPFWLFDPAEQRLLMSSYHIAPATFADYVRAIEAFRPAAIEGYPSAVALVARAFEELGRVPFPLKAVFTSSETVLEAQRELIGRVFQCPILDLYGNTERTAAITSCAHGSYHILTDYAVVELLPLPAGGHEIVGTPLFNKAFPLLRYRSGDVAEPGDTPCPCGRPFPTVRSIVGRVEGYVWTPEGRAIGRLDHIFKGTKHIVESQIVQEAPDHVVIRIVPDAGFSDADEKLVVANARERLGPTMRISVERTGRIERTPQGKFLAVVSRIQPPHGNAAPDVSTKESTS
jgi:phenylacetate-CoA ligase